MNQIIANYFGTPLIIGIRTKLYSNEILFFEGEVNYARIHFKSGKQQVIARTLLYIQNKINTENFIRINRKYLVNRKFIVEVGDDFVVLSDKTVLPISRRRKREFFIEVS
jgi:DNA-binding LytR/AlgR family response regulator